MVACPNSIRLWQVPKISFAACIDGGGRLHSCLHVDPWAVTFLCNGVGDPHQVQHGHCNKFLTQLYVHLGLQAGDPERAWCEPVDDLSLSQTTYSVCSDRCSSLLILTSIREDLSENASLMHCKAGSCDYPQPLKVNVAVAGAELFQANDSVRCCQQIHNIASRHTATIPLSCSMAQWKTWIFCHQCWHVS